MNLSATIQRLEEEGFTPDQIVKMLKCLVLGEQPAASLEEIRAERKREADRVRMAERRANEPNWEDIRAFVLSVYEPFCVYCGEPDPISVDHVIPFAKGGAADITNLVPACGRCNSGKRDRDLKEWLQCR